MTLTCKSPLVIDLILARESFGWCFVDRLKMFTIFWWEWHRNKWGFYATFCAAGLSSICRITTHIIVEYTRLSHSCGKLVIMKFTSGLSWVGLNEKGRLIDWYQALPSGHYHCKLLIIWVNGSMMCAPMDRFASKKTWLRGNTDKWRPLTGHLKPDTPPPQKAINPHSLYK